MRASLKRALLRKHCFSLIFYGNVKQHRWNPLCRKGSIDFVFYNDIRKAVAFCTEGTMCESHGFFIKN